MFGQVFTSVLVLGVFFSVFIITDIRSYKQRKVDDLMSLAQVLGANCVSTLQFQDNEEANKILSELKNVAPEIVHAVLLDTNQAFFAGYGRTGADSFHAPVIKNNNYIFTGQRLFVTKDVLDQNQKIVGKVILEADLTELQEIKQSKYRLAFILLLAALGFSFLVAIVIQQYISNRLLSLVNTMKEVSDTGNYNKTIADNGKDEISSLISVFNNLMQQVNINQQRKDEFISIASHELKTPLTTIKGYLELLNEMEDKQPNKQFVENAWKNVNKLEKLVKDLLDVSKIQSGQLELTMNEFNIDTLLSEAVASVQMISGSHKISREDNFNGEMIWGDRSRIEQVLVNLLSNAIKYSPGERLVIISGNKTDSDMVIKVRDFGIGIPKNEQSNIFERFYRTKDISITISGFGLGLYICRDIIRRHNGKIWVETEEKGSSFYFSLPLKR